MRKGYEYVGEVYEAGRKWQHYQRTTVTGYRFEAYVSDDGWSVSDDHIAPGRNKQEANWQITAPWNEFVYTEAKKRFAQTRPRRFKTFLAAARKIAKEGGEWEKARQRRALMREYMEHERKASKIRKDIEAIRRISDENGLAVDEGGLEQMEKFAKDQDEAADQIREKRNAL